mmetsp:Transcript_25484/g.22487  ORF Transcript_25484/g.22487 Transcript_25484/m.22487 type:complete len:108 (+) Transcript_25484:268-591(+)
MQQVEEMIKQYSNYNEEGLSKINRWDKIELLRSIANEHPEVEELKKYARDSRYTTKEQREKYQSDINTLFMTLIDNLSRDVKISSDEEGDRDDLDEINVETMIDKEL